MDPRFISILLTIIGLLNTVMCLRRIGMQLETEQSQSGHSYGSYSLIKIMN